ncbi:hypothetical protein Golax_020830 [Gossypium laxum]|uniref:F-box domain-containing protein n=1 Tax=Gossypium laxum TaxID=34288 RepID=A0A7J9AJL3_9ROSI|nr:hypothetical protein [Gossypium laxum]
MELVSRTSSLKLKHDCMNEKRGENLGLGFVRYTHGLRRKRIGISNEIDDGTKASSLKRRCSKRMMIDDDDNCYETSALESLPQDIIIKIICGVDHEDLKRLPIVSKSIREAAMVAKQLHFAYSTPTKVKAFKTSIDFDEQSESNDLELEAPNAPQQWRSHRSINKKKLADISIQLFL